MEKWEKEEGASNRGGPFFTLPVFKSVGLTSIDHLAYGDGQVGSNGAVLLLPPVKKQG